MQENILQKSMRRLTKTTNANKIPGSPVKPPFPQYHPEQILEKERLEKEGDGDFEQTLIQTVPSVPASSHLAAARSSADMSLIERDLLDLNQKLLNSIITGDWMTYKDLCDESLTCFEPESRGEFVKGLEFHRFYFDNLDWEGIASQKSKAKATMASPNVRIIGENVAIITYVRLLQTISEDGEPSCSKTEETRVWQLMDEGWKNVHFHKAVPS
mmetsp:Transcript_54247/g.63392  ORF Transcript_54247/g.63392 Transcript_54247/m.63392 type:complete len:214 (-) Transcript_54247:45-686(-)